jgi:hypothetical protein
MATHINAFFADVDEQRQKVLDAHSAWEEAKARLEVKKKEVGYEETPPEEVKVEETEFATTSKKK